MRGVRNILEVLLIKNEIEKMNTFTCMPVGNRNMAIVHIVYFVYKQIFFASLRPQLAPVHLAFTLHVWIQNILFPPVFYRKKPKRRSVSTTKILFMLTFRKVPFPYYLSVSVFSPTVCTLICCLHIVLVSLLVWTTDLSMSMELTAGQLPSFGRPVHGLAVQSWRHANASPPGGKACSEGHRPTIKKESNVKNEKWLLVSNRQRRLASSSPRRSAPHLSEMQGSLPRVSLKTQILSSGVLLLGITKHRQHPFVLQIGSTRRILALLPRTTKGATCQTAQRLKINSSQG